MAGARGRRFSTVKEMIHKTSKVLFSYWNSVRRDRMAPQRFEIDPARISAILPNTFILERLDAETFRFRLAGTRICDIFGSELRGTNFLDGWQTIDRLPLLRVLSTLVREGAAGLVHLEVGAVAEKPIPCEVLLLPLRHTREAVDRVLGSFSPLEEPAWLGVKPVSTKRVSANEIVWPTRDPLPTLSRAPEPMVTPSIVPSIGPRTARIVRSERRQFSVFDGGRGRTDGDEV
jgi:hypothetical protein